MVEVCPYSKYPVVLLLKGRRLVTVESRSVGPKMEAK